jgi:hypothetical protein
MFIVKRAFRVADLLRCNFTKKGSEMSVEKNSQTLECRRDFTGRMEKIALMRSSEKKIVD